MPAIKLNNLSQASTGTVLPGGKRPRIVLTHSPLMGRPAPSRSGVTHRKVPGTGEGSGWDFSVLIKNLNECVTTCLQGQEPIPSPFINALQPGGND